MKAAKKRTAFALGLLLACGPSAFALSGEVSPEERLVSGSQAWRAALPPDSRPALARLWSSPYKQASFTHECVYQWDVTGDGNDEYIVLFRSLDPRAERHKGRYGDDISPIEMPLELAVISLDSGRPETLFSAELPGCFFWNIKPYAYGPLVADLDGNGIPELYIASSPGASIGATLCVFTYKLDQQGKPTFELAKLDKGGFSFSSIQFKDGYFEISHRFEPGKTWRVRLESTADGQPQLSATLAPAPASTAPPSAVAAPPAAPPPVQSPPPAPPAGYGPLPLAAATGGAGLLLGLALAALGLRLARRRGRREVKP